jgi:hypothetical protein
MRKLLLALLFLCFASTAQAALSKGVAQVDGWMAVAQNATTVGATATLSGNYQTALVIDAALTSVTATTNGLGIVVEGSSTTSGDNNWYQIASYTALAGVTAITNNMTSNISAAATLIPMTNTTGFATFTNSSLPSYLTNLVYIKDSTINNSEVRTQTTFSSNANITVDTGVTNAHANNTAIWNSVANNMISIPDSTYRIRVIYNNKLDPSGSSADVRSNVVNITAI